MAVPFTAIANGLNSLGTSILNGLQSVGTFIIDGIEYLFIPDTEGLQEEFNGLMDNVTDSLPIIEQVKTVINAVIDTDYSNGTAPKFEITVYGTTCNIIDFTFFIQNKQIIQDFIVTVIWFGFLIRLFTKRIPRLIETMR